jgi:predicted PurR-regulated permease PerM
VTDHEPNGASAPPPNRDLLWQTLRVALVLVAVAAIVAIVVHATGVFLLAFGGIVVAVLLRTPAAFISRHTPLPPRVALTIVVLLGLVAFAVFFWLGVPSLADQARQIAARMPQALEAVDEWLSSIGVDGFAGGARSLLPSPDALMGTVPGIVGTTFGALGALLVMLALGVYLAASPHEYREGLVRLAAVERRDNLRATLDAVGNVLHRWMLGQLVCMAFVGVASYAALALLGVPVAFGLAVLAGLLEFVPYLGPIIATVPVVLIAATESWTLALYALIAFVVIQQIESYVVTPLVQRRAVYLPPALLIFLQILLGVLFGLAGVVLATPLAAVGLVVVQRAYVRTMLEKPAEEEAAHARE